VDTSDGPIRILVADGHSLFRESVIVVLRAEQDLAIVADARDGDQLATEISLARPDVVILDLNLPGCDGVHAVRLVKEHASDCRILALADHEDQRALLEVVEAGASGYLTKDCPLAELIDATRAVARGEIVIPRWMLGTLLSHLVRRRRERDEALRRMSRLTRREREVLALLTDGADNEAIAEKLFISPETARTHVQNLLGKLEVHSRLEAAAFVVGNGILDEVVRVEL
jgi:DNA-binding NarL/FixJ family response regulator